MAFAVLLVEFVLSGRFRLISGRMGMDVGLRVRALSMKIGSGGPMKCQLQRTACAASKPA